MQETTAELNMAAMNDWGQRLGADAARLVLTRARGRTPSRANCRHW